MFQLRVRHRYWLIQAHCDGCGVVMGAANISSSMNIGTWKRCNQVEYIDQFKVIMAATYVYDN